jgi:hypothetical protein
MESSIILTKEKYILQQYGLRSRESEDETFTDVMCEPLSHSVHFSGFHQWVTAICLNFALKCHYLLCEIILRKNTDGGFTKVSY